MERDKQYRKIMGCFLGLWLLTGLSGCFSDPKGKRVTHIPEAIHAETLFRYLMMQTRLMRCDQKGCLAFGNPLSAPSSQFLGRFGDFENELVDLQDLEWRNEKKILCNKKNASVILYQISGATRIDGNAWLLEGGWFRSPEDSKKCLYQLIRSGHKWHVLELRVMDRCRHVIIRNESASKKEFLLQRLAY